MDEIEEVLSANPMISVRRVSQEVNLSKTVVYRAMRDVLGYKPYKMYLTQQLYDEDKDLHVVMVEILLPILNDKNNDGLIFFLMKQHFLFQAWFISIIVVFGLEKILLLLWKLQRTH